MKIERVSENQIKFYLTEADMTQRGLQLHELSYGSPKAQELFNEIMQRAHVEHNFQAPPGTPMVIEAVPMSADSIMVIVTKVAGPQDMDARFGFPPVLGQLANPDMAARYAEYIQNLLREPHGHHPHPLAPHMAPNGAPHAPPFAPPVSQPEAPAVTIFAFGSLDQVIMAAPRTAPYISQSALYKHDGKFYLVIDTKKEPLPDHLHHALKEYSTGPAFRNLSEAYLQEHGEVFIAKNALQSLASLA